MNTREEILELAQAFIQTRGYNGFSYGDIAEPLGIKNASIHYHFPKKERLGVAVVQRYIETFDVYLNDVSETTTDPWDRFEKYLIPFISVRESKTKICLCAALGGEFLGLPETVQDEVARFFAAHERWVSSMIKFGIESREFKPDLDAAASAKHTISALQGGLIVARAKNEPTFFESVVDQIKDGWRK